MYWRRPYNPLGASHSISSVQRSLSHAARHLEMLENYNTPYCASRLSSKSFHYQSLQLPLLRNLDSFCQCSDPCIYGVSLRLQSFTLLPQIFQRCRKHLNELILFQLRPRVFVLRYVHIDLHVYHVEVGIAKSWVCVHSIPSACVC